MVLRDRNHPSVIMWSIGNEISERSDPDGVEIARNLSGRVRELDTTRPVTMAVPLLRCQASTALERHRCRLPIPRCLWLQLYEGSLRIRPSATPSRVMMGTESFPVQVAENWELVNKHSYVIGDFVWTGIDYIGESALGAAVLTPDKPFCAASGSTLRTGCGGRAPDNLAQEHHLCQAGLPLVPQLLRRHRPDRQ